MDTFSIAENEAGIRSENSYDEAHRGLGLNLIPVNHDVEQQEAALHASEALRSHRAAGP